jgi:hypothetical protein
MNLLVKPMMVHSAVRRASHHDDELEEIVKTLIKDLRDQREQHAGLKIDQHGVELQTPQLGTVWVQRDWEIKHHPRDEEQGKGKNPDSDVEMTTEEIPLWVGSRTPKWIWSPLYGAIHQGDLCPDCNNQVEHVSEGAIDRVPSLTVTQQYPEQLVKHEYDHGWDDSERAQVEGHGLDIDCICSAMHMLATCVVKTTSAIKRALENTNDHAHVMSRNRISDRLWENTIRESMSIDKTPLLSLPKTEIVEFADDLVVSTPHGNIAIKHKNPMDKPVIHMAVIQTTGKRKTPMEHRPSGM